MSSTDYGNCLRLSTLCPQQQRWQPSKKEAALILIFLQCFGDKADQYCPDLLKEDLVTAVSGLNTHALYVLSHNTLKTEDSSSQSVNGQGKIALKTLENYGNPLIFLKAGYPKKYAKERSLFLTNYAQLKAWILKPSEDFPNALIPFLFSKCFLITHSGTNFYWVHFLCCFYAGISGKKLSSFLPLQEEIITKHTKEVTDYLLPYSLNRASEEEMAPEKYWAFFHVNTIHQLFSKALCYYLDLPYLHIPTFIDNYVKKDTENAIFFLEVLSVRKYPIDQDRYTNLLPLSKCFLESINNLRKNPPENFLITSIKALFYSLILNSAGKETKGDLSYTPSAFFYQYAPLIIKHYDNTIQKIYPLAEFLQSYKIPNQSLEAFLQNHKQETDKPIVAFLEQSQAVLRERNPQDNFIRALRRFCQEHPGKPIPFDATKGLEETTLLIEASFKKIDASGNNPLPTLAVLSLSTQTPEGEKS